MTNKAEQINADFLNDIESRLQKIKMTANFTGLSFIVLGVLAILTNISMAVFPEELGIHGIKITAFIATVSITIIGAFNLPKKSNQTREAWKHLNKAVLNFKANNIDSKTLITAFEESENLLGNIDFKYNLEKEAPSKS